MFMRLAIACFALYCVHGAQNSTRDGAALAREGANLMREASAEAPRAALAFCLENQTLCTRVVGGTQTAQTAPAASPATPLPVVDFPLPPRRPAAHKKA